MIGLWCVPLGELTLPEALAAWPGACAEPIALTYAPEACRFARWEAGTLRGPDGPLPLDRIFEARVFQRQCEMRWLQGSGGRGPAVLLRADDRQGREPHPGAYRIDALDVLERTYLLWGEGVRAAPGGGGGDRLGWSRLADHRIGVLEVPHTGLAAGAPLWLLAREYLGAADGYGNVQVLEECLCDLVTADALPRGVAGG